MKTNITYCLYRFWHVRKVCCLLKMRIAKEKKDNTPHPTQTSWWIFTFQTISMFRAFYIFWVKNYSLPSIYSQGDLILILVSVRVLFFQHQITQTISTVCDISPLEHLTCSRESTQVGSIMWGRGVTLHDFSQMICRHITWPFWSPSFLLAVHTRRRKTDQIMWPDFVLYLRLCIVSW